MSTLQRLKNSLGFDSEISKLISNTEPGIDSISEVYQALYDLHQQSAAALEELETQLNGNIRTDFIGRIYRRNETFIVS